MAGRYEVESLTSEGFIHCSERAQVTGTANLLFRGRDDLVLLVIDEQRLDAPVKREPAVPGGPLFPHIYGPLNLDAVAQILPFSPGEDGTFVLPPPAR